VLTWVDWWVAGVKGDDGGGSVIGGGVFPVVLEVQKEADNVWWSSGMMRI
jgi:hypothetical protein